MRHAAVVDIEIWVEDRLALSAEEGGLRLDPQARLLLRGISLLVAGNYETAAAILKERVAITPTTDLSRALLASAWAIWVAPRRPARSGASLRRSIHDTLTQTILADCRLEILRMLINSPKACARRA